MLALSLVLQLLGACVALFAVARAAYYPFWAAGADPAELARSWGGPSPLGATLAHWVLAAALAAAGWVVLRIGSRQRLVATGR